MSLHDRKQQIFPSNLTCSHLPILQNCFGAQFKLGATMDICQNVKHQLQGDKIWNYHAQLSQVLHSFRTSKYVFQDMQEGNMLCGRYGPHMPQIQQMVFKQCGL